jgi:hypothetical protein
MEIQTFFLAETIERKADHCHDVRRAALTMVSCTAAASFPTRFTLPALVLLRRESDSSDAPIRLRFDLVDEDGKPAGRPRRWLVEGVFPLGSRFYYVMAKIPFEFPAPGRYRLDITPNEGLEGAVYHYAVDIVPKERGAA